MWARRTAEEALEGCAGHRQTVDEAEILEVEANTAVGEDIGDNPPVATPQTFHLLFGSGNGLKIPGNLIFP